MKIKTVRPHMGLLFSINKKEADAEEGLGRGASNMSMFKE